MQILTLSWKSLDGFVYSLSRLTKIQMSISSKCLSLLRPLIADRIADLVSNMHTRSVGVKRFETVNEGIKHRFSE